MGFFSSLGSAISSVGSSGLSKENLDNRTYQRYTNEIKKFNINPPTEMPINMDKTPKFGRISDRRRLEERHSAIDNIETLDDVKAYFAQRENKE